MNKKEIEFLNELIGYCSISCEDKILLQDKLKGLSEVNKRGTRLPDDWELPDEWGQWALGEGFDGNQILKIADQFRDFWIAKTGKEAVKVNWYSTWRNWVRRQQ